MLAFEADGHKWLGFNTGLTARAFAQAKFAQFITEPGLIVRPEEASPARIEYWKASGVREAAGPDGQPVMVIWGPPFEGDRLDALLNECPQQDKVLQDKVLQDKVLAAIGAWIQAILVVEENSAHPAPPPWPCAALVAQSDGRCPAVFFAPPSLVMRNITANDERYVNPGLSGMHSAAFTAAAMLYRVFAGNPPFSAAGSPLYQDMRDSNFLPVHLAVPGLDARLAALIQSGLTDPPGPKGPSGPDAPGSAHNGTALLAEFLAVVSSHQESGDSLIRPLPEADLLLLEKEKSQFLKVKTASVKARRFIARNTALLLGLFAAAAGAAFVAHSILSTRANLPTTAGMNPVQVIESYYRAFGELDHQMMEACVTGKAGKDDIRTVINFFVLNKTRQAYEFNAAPMVLPAHEWQGADHPASPLFGASDLHITALDGDAGGATRYRLEYTFWIPAQAAGETSMEQPGDDSLSLSYHRSDVITLVQKKGNWQISEILRE